MTTSVVTRLVRSAEYQAKYCESEPRGCGFNNISSHGPSMTQDFISNSNSFLFDTQITRVLQKWSVMGHTKFCYSFIII